MNRTSPQEQGPKSRNRRNAGLAATTVVGLAALAGVLVSRDSDSQSESRTTDGVPVTLSTLPEAFSPEEQALVKDVSTFTNSVVEFVKGQEGNPNVRYEQTSSESTTQPYETRTTRVTRDIENPDGTFTRFTISVDEDDFDRQTGMVASEFSPSIVTLSTYPIDNPGEEFSGHGIDFEIIPLTDGHWRLGGRLTEDPNENFVFHSTEAGRISDPDISKVFEPITQDWLDGRIAVGNDIMAQISA